jgi:cytosine deaminase
MNAQQISMALKSQARFVLKGVRLPKWTLPNSEFAEKLDITVSNGQIESIAPQATHTNNITIIDLKGALLMPLLVDAHTHLDKTLTRSRMGNITPGLLGAIHAMMSDRTHWTPADVHQRASQGLEWSYAAGVHHVRTHCDWWEPQTQPIAWQVLKDLAEEWRGKIHIERASLIPLHLYADRDQAFALAKQVADSGSGALLGGFVHTSNWNLQALENLFAAAQAHQLNVDLHMDEELNPQAQGLLRTTEIMQQIKFSGHVVCGHTCALSTQDASLALRTLDEVAKVNMSLVTLPLTNLLLQDAVTGKTPTQRGVTLVQEARARGIPVMVASDNVQDPFCTFGSYDPLEALTVGALAAQLPDVFDQATQSVCRSDWLTGEKSPTRFEVGNPANFIVLTQANIWGFPSQTHERLVFRNGEVSPS